MKKVEGFYTKKDGTVSDEGMYKEVYEDVENIAEQAQHSREVLKTELGVEDDVLDFLYSSEETDGTST